MVPRLHAVSGRVNGEAKSGATVWAAVLWAGLLIAFSPVLLDLWGLWRDQPWSRVSLVFPALIFVAARHDTTPPGPASWGWALVLVGILLELLAVGGGIVRIGRLGLGAAAIGLCLARGWTSVRVALLFAWAIPMPASLLNLVSPLGEWLQAALAETAIAFSGLPIERSGAVFRIEGRELGLRVRDSGLQTAVALAGFGWSSAILRHRSRSGILRTATACALIAFPLHFLVTTAAVLSFALGSASDRIYEVLDVFSWAGVMIVGLIMVFGWPTVRVRRSSGIE